MAKAATAKVKTVQALPGSGKSWMARRYPDSYIDSDVVAGVMDMKTARKFAAKIEDPSIRSEFTRRLREEAGGRTILCNFWPTYLGFAEEEVIARVAYKPDEYVQHLKFCGRGQLVRDIGETKLRFWAEQYATLDKVTYLPIGKFLSDVLAWTNNSGHFLA